MNESLLLFLVVIFGLMIIALMVFVVRLAGKSKNYQNDPLQQDLKELSRDMLQFRESISEKVGEKLERNQHFMHESLQRQSAQSTKIITEITQKLAKLDETNRRVVDVAEELKTLQNVLQNPKQRGVLGEYFLQTVLENVLPPDRFSLQYRFKDGEIVDAAIFLDKKKVLPVDSKFSLENYNRLLEEKDKDKRTQLSKQIKIDLKNRIDETSKYIRPSEGTMDFAFMFIPSEAVYYDLLINKIGGADTTARDLIEYAFRDKHVIIVSPTSFMAYLQTVLQGLRSLQIEEQAKDIQIRVGQLGRHLITHESLMQKMGNSLAATVNHFNNAHKEFKKVDKDIVKISNNETFVEPLAIDKPLSDD